MKKLLPFVLSFVFISTSFAYNPTLKDANDLNDLKTKLNQLVEDNNINLWDFYNQLKNLEVEHSADERLFFMLSHLKSHLYNKLFTLKTTAYVSAKDFKQEFLSGKMDNITIDVDEEVLDKCVWWYNTMDEISFAYDFPTALTIATWYRESTCAYYLPSNGDGPFQIVKEDYGTWEINEKVFIDTIVDFMEFTKDKFDRYEWDLSGSLSYTEFDLAGIHNFAALYNWGTKSGNIIIPNAPEYLLDGYGEQYSDSTRYGILPKFLKVLQRELENN